MADKIKKGDFVEIDFVGRIKSTGQIFDLTVQDVANKEGLGEREQLKPLIACVGAGHLLQHFDEQLVGKSIGEEFEFDLSPEKAFGTKNPKLIQLTSDKNLRKNGINPIAGMRLDIDGMMATVRSVTGGRVILDFNHPLAGKELHYWVKIRRMITDYEEKVRSITHMLGVPCGVTVKNKVAEIKLKEPNVPKDKREFISTEIKKLIPEAKVNLV